VIFTEWFQEKFGEMDVEPRAGLLLDNCSAHINEDKRMEK